MKFSERAITFECAGNELLGILTEPEKPNKIGVVIIVGGPQYRIGSHRQFVLLARALGAAGYSCLRFDHRGMGDSAGEAQGFEQLNTDINAAIDTICAQSPGIRRVVLWGLCDAASAILLYWHVTHDQRIVSLIMLNPWVRAEHTLAQTRVRYYYGQRLFQPDFWRRLLSGKIELKNAGREFLRQAKMAMGIVAKTQNAAIGFQDKMAEALHAFPNALLVILSEEDYTAKEFSIWLGRNNSNWQPGGRLAVEHVAEADHTFSTSDSWNKVEASTLGWLGQLVEVDDA